MSTEIEFMNDAITTPCDYWGDEASISVGKSRLLGLIELDINGNHVYLEDDTAKALVNHLNNLLSH